MIKTIFIYTIKIFAYIYKQLSKSKYISFILAFLIGVGVIAYVLPSQKNEANQVVKSQILNSKAPPISFNKIGEKEINTSNEPNPPKTVIFFWQTWCMNCIDYIKQISDLPEVKNNELRVIAVNSNEERGSVEYFIKQNFLEKNIYFSFDENGENYKHFNVIKTPQIFFIKNSIIKDFETNFGDTENIKYLISEFTNDYKNSTKSEYLEGVKILVNPAKIKILCRTNETFNYDSLTSLPNPIKPKDDIGFDCVSPVEEPLFTSSETLKIKPESKYIKVNFGNINHFYPFEYASAHIVINDVINEMPISVVFDPLTYTVSAYKSLIEGELTSLGVAGRIYEHSTLLYDRKTFSFWYNGESIYGSQAGKKLESIPFSIVSGKEIIESKNNLVMTIPDSRVDYSKSNFQEFWSNGEYFYELSRPKTKENKDIISIISNNTVTFKGNIFYKKIGSNLDFDVEGDYLKDRQTGSLWDENGKCVLGQLRGNYLEKAIIKYGMRFNL